MAAAKINLVIEKGAKFTKKFIWQDANKAPIDNSAYEARMQIRETLESSTIVLELTTTTSGITLGGANGEINLEIGATVTDAITIKSGVYDLELYDPLDLDDVIRLIQGQINVVQSVTR